MHQRVSLSLSFQFFSNNFKIILSIDVRQLLYLSSHECCNLVETLGIVDKRLLSDLIGSWTRPVLDSRFHLPPCVSYLDGINAISYMHYSYKTYIYIYICTRQTAYHLSLRCVLVSKRIHVCRETRNASLLYAF